jgi:SAM-dependent methyltransferase
MPDDRQLTQTLALREQIRDEYWLTRDPILTDRLRWRCMSFRHLVHLLPGQTVLELGTGRGLFARELSRVTRGLNPITAISFGLERERPHDATGAIEFATVESFPQELRGRRFDYVVATDLLDRSNCAWLLSSIHDLLEPGGEFVLFETNPWNVFLKARRAIWRLLGRGDPRRLLSRPDIYELLSDVGFIRVFAICNDFLYAPLTPGLIWLLRGLSVILENAPVIRTIAGSILIHAQRPPRDVQRPKVSLCEHDSLRRKISVVVPCYNEEMNVRPLVEKLTAFYGDYLHEIVLVDDNSKDGTAEMLKRLALDNPLVKPVIRSPPGGVGRALTDGYKAASGEYVLSMDCDFHQLLPEMRDLFDAAAEGWDVVVGSRFSRHSVLLNYPFKKILANRGFHLLARIMLWRRFRDLTNNLKLVRRSVLDSLELREPAFAVNAETGLKPLLMGYSLKEVPVSWINRTSEMGVSSFRLTGVGGSYCRVLFRLWAKQVFGGGRPAKRAQLRSS